ncbi:diacylglycerol/lipid kinase family protein [Corallincola platygyrae]|uniref:Diacylglycerol/lipid kinase family protein n=1 Tax=Corallincola platygyrae TaxID=1193278 RepID=A0ABW4XQ43_9GAMM
MYAVIVNPLSGCGQALSIAKRVMQRIEKAGEKGRLIHCYALENLRHQLQQAADNGVINLVIVGGDGTAHQIINHLPHYDFNIGFVPAGSGNDLVRALELGHCEQEQIDVALFTPPQSVPLGRCNGSYFLTSVGIGFEGHIAHQAAGKRRGRRASYHGAILGNLFNYQHHKAKFVNCQWKSDEEFLMCTVANSPFSGGGFKVAPGASLQNRELSLVRMAPIGGWSRLPMMFKVAKGDHVEAPTVKQINLNQLEIRASQRIPAHIDGEPFYANRFCFSSSDTSIKVRCLGLR